MADGSVRLDDLKGLWTRSLLEWPDGRRDETSVVEWLQGPTLFVDLRSPVARPSFDGVHRLRDLTFDQVEWLARQEGFAGELRHDGAFFEWRRGIDYQPATGAADAGSLEMADDVLIERGRDERYLEHWRRNVSPGLPPAEAFALRDVVDGRAAYLVRVGDVFMYARDRIQALPAGCSLIDLAMSAQTLGAAQDVVDFEISKGVVLDGGAWPITRSSLPYREGCDLTVKIDVARTRISSSDSRPDGRAFLRNWVIEKTG